MSSCATTMGWAGIPSIPIIKAKSDTGSRYSYRDAIVIDDIKDSDRLVNSTNDKFRFLYSLGITPSPAIFNQGVQKFVLAVLVSAILSTWISNAYILGIFVILNLANFLVSLIWEKQRNFNEKISMFVADLLLVSILGTIVDITLKAVKIPLIEVQVPTFQMVIWFMIFHYIFLLSKKLYPLTSINKSQLLLNIVLSIRDGLKYGNDSFNDRQERKVLENSDTK